MDLISKRFMLIVESLQKSQTTSDKVVSVLASFESSLSALETAMCSTKIETNFADKTCQKIKDSGMGLTKQLAQSAQETFADFEEAVEKDATKISTVLDGSIHPLTSYVMKYINLLFDFESTLKQLFLEFGKGGGDNSTNSQLALIIVRIMQALQNNLDGKSKEFKDPALAHLFLMNNIQYMVTSVCSRSEDKDLLGNDWDQIYRKIVQNHALQYRKSAWTKIMQSLSVKGMSLSGNNVSGGVSKRLLKERLKMFTKEFDELHQIQSEWTVPDTMLRESLKLYVAEVLTPAYHNFLKRFGRLVESGKTSQKKYIKYTVEDVETLLAKDFFEGKSIIPPQKA